MRRHGRSRHLPVLRLAALAVLVLATAACGGPSGADAQVASASDGAGGGTSTKDAARREVDAEQAGLDFARCMREHGVDIPDPQSGGDGFIMIGPANSAAESSESSGAPTAGQPLPEGLAEADEACRHFLDDLIQDGGGPMDPEAQDKALKFAKCMREHGVDMPDPDFSGGPGGFRVEIGVGGGGIDPDSQTFRDAHEACGDLFGPDGPGGPGGGRTAVASSGVRS